MLPHVARSARIVIESRYRPTSGACSRASGKCFRSFEKAFGTFEKLFRNSEKDFRNFGGGFQSFWKRSRNFERDFRGFGNGLRLVGAWLRPSPLNSGAVFLREDGRTEPAHPPTSWGVRSDPFLIHYPLPFGRGFRSSEPRKIEADRALSQDESSVFQKSTSFARIADW